MSERSIAAAEVLSNPPAPESAGHVDPQGLSASKYAQTKQELMELVNQLRANGAYLDVDLPSIVVTGNQSSGKSSLIEAISAVALPRNEDTCTRVPTEIRLRQTVEQSWQCLVKIRREEPMITEQPGYGKHSAVQGAGHGKSSEGKTPGKGPIAAIERQFGDVIFEPQHVCQRARQAQWRILCSDPDVPDESFLSDKTEVSRRGDSTRNFSRDVIVLEISGPDLTDLSLVDLPGAIANSPEKGEPRFIQRLITEYISRECLILLCMSVTEDFSNSMAVSLIQEVDPDGQRTIGVLTKLDVIKETRANMWIAIANGERPHERLDHGYFLTRHPDAEQRKDGMTFDAARAAEARFFASNKLWSSLPLHLRERCGTTHLVRYLSDQLVRYIRSRLPGLEAEVAAAVSQTVNDLAHLPAPSGDPQQQVLSLIDGYISEIQRSTDGAKGAELFWQKVNSELRLFKSNVWATAPLFTPHTLQEIHAEERDPEAYRTKKPMPVTVEPVSGNNHRGPAFEGPAAGTGKEEMVSQASNRRFSQPLLDIEDVADPELGPSGTHGRTYNLSSVRAAIEEARTRELPNEVPPQVKTHLITESIEAWANIVNELLTAVRPIVRDLLRGWTDTMFDPFRAGLLYAEVDKIVAEMLEYLTRTTGAQMIKIVRLELRPFTLNDHYLEDLTTKYVKQYKDARHDALALVTVGEANESTRQEAEDALAAALAKLGMSNVTLKDLTPNKYSDKYEREIQLMAERIIDNAPRIIIDELTEPLATELKAALRTRLGVLGKDAYPQCEAYLSEGPEIVMKREALQMKRRSLEEASDKLTRLLRA